MLFLRAFREIPRFGKILKKHTAADGRKNIIKKCIRNKNTSLFFDQKDRKWQNLTTLYRFMMITDIVWHSLI